MAIVTIKEYGRLHVGSIFEPESLTITRDQADLLTNQKQTYGYDVFKYVNGTTIAAQQYVGVVQLGPHTFEVLPKIDGSETNVRRNLVGMLAVALDLEVSEGDAAKVATQNHGVLEILIRLFCDKLFAQVHRGLVRRYEGREENLHLLRGKLSVVDQLRRNVANPERLFCHFDEFQEDIPLNQVLKAALRFLLKRSADLNNQRQLAELLLAFEAASDCAVGALPWHRVTFDRLSERYRSCYKLAELFLKNTPPDVSGGKKDGFSLFFDMNELFEKYVGRVAMRTFYPYGFKVSLQDSGHHLAFDVDSKRAAFALKPDVVGYRDTQPEWILDTKWKSLSVQEIREGVAQSDMYQMYAYANCYDCPEVILLYPHHANLGNVPGVRNTFLLSPWLGEDGTRGKQIKIATLDLSDLSTVSSQLRGVTEAVSCPESVENVAYGRTSGLTETG